MHRKKAFVTLIITLLILYFGQSVVSASEQPCKAEITALLKNYERALNRSNVNEVMQLYAKDSIFMPSNKPTAVGYAQVTKAYQHVFEDLNLEVSFHIDEILVRDDLAFVRTVSDGKITLLKKDMVIKNNSRELFIMKRVQHHWKIFRYIFNETGTQH